MLAVIQRTADGVRNQPRKLDPLIFSDRSYALLKYVSRVACLLCTWPPVIHTCCDTCYRHCHTRTLKYVDVRFPDLWLVNFTKCSILTGRNWHICETLPNIAGTLHTGTCLNFILAVSQRHFDDLLISGQ